MPIHRVAVIGGGVAGLACARVLHGQGRIVTVFDRGLRPGGRLSVRRIPLSNGSITYADHGAPFFACTGERFRVHLASWVDQGLCAVWNPVRRVWSDGRLIQDSANEPLFVGVPDARSITSHLAANLHMVGGTTLTAISRVARRWELRMHSRDGAAAANESFDSVVMAAAPQQIARVFGEHSEKISREIGGARATCCWVHTVLLAGTVPGLPNVLRVTGDDLIELVVHENTKPGRLQHDHLSLLVVYARSDWSASMYESQPESVGRAMTDRLLTLLRAITGRHGELSEFSPAAAHRWGLARPASIHSCECTVDEALRLVACGDGFGGSGLEAAYLSGRAASAAVLSFDVQS